MPKAEQQKLPFKEEIKNVVLKSVAYRDDQLTSLIVGKPESVARITKEAKQGNVSDFVKAAEDAYDKDMEIGQSIDTRISGVIACPVVFTPADESAKAKEIAESIKEIWGGIPDVEDFMEDLLDAIPLGFALAQIRLTDTPVDGLWRIKEIDTIPPETLIFRYENTVLDFPRLRTKDFSPYGIALEPYRETLIFHNKRKKGSCLKSGLMHSLLWSALFKKFTLKDWLAFCERYGAPLVIGKHGQYVGDEDKKKLIQAVKSLSNDAAAVISDMMNIEIVEAAKTGSTFTFEHLSKFLNEGIVKKVLGQTKTSQGDGGSLALAKIHNEIRSDKTERDTKGLASTLRNQLIKRLVVWNWGIDAIELSPKLTFVYEAPERRQQRREAIKMGYDLGMKLPLDFLHEELGIPSPEEDEEFVQKPAGGAGGGPFEGRASIEGESWLRE